MTLYALERMAEGWEIADRCVAMDLTPASAFTRATFYEMVGDRFYMGDDEDEDTAHDWWSRAVAFYLSADSVKDATRLSKEFIPEAAEEQVQ